MSQGWKRPSLRGALISRGTSRSHTPIPDEWETPSAYRWRAGNATPYGRVRVTGFCRLIVLAVLAHWHQTLRVSWAPRFRAIQDERSWAARFLPIRRTLAMALMGLCDPDVLDSLARYVSFAVWRRMSKERGVGSRAWAAVADERDQDPIRRTHLYELSRLYV
ncbi:MAG: hypothetical protein ACREYC_21505 [Gammaproteobacteria bacterium]